ERLVEQRFVLLAREQKHANITVQLSHLAQGVQALVFRQLSIEQHDLREQFGGFAERLDTIASLSDNLQIGITLQQTPQACARDGLIINDQHAHFRRFLRCFLIRVRSWHLVSDWYTRARNILRYILVLVRGRCWHKSSVYTGMSTMNEVM